MLLGEFKANFGASRRIAIPSKFLKELGDTLIVSRLYEDCLVLVAKSEWGALLARLKVKTDEVTPESLDTERLILGSAYEVTPDFQGRIVIPENLAKFAHLKKQVVFLGLGEKVEIWDGDIWNLHQKKVEASGFKPK